MDRVNHFPKCSAESAIITPRQLSRVHRPAVHIDMTAHGRGDGEADSRSRRGAPSCRCEGRHRDRLRDDPHAAPAAPILPRKGTRSCCAPASAWIATRYASA
jgi:hypothetical protein